MFAQTTHNHQHYTTTTTAITTTTITAAATAVVEAVAATTHVWVLSEHNGRVGDLVQRRANDAVGHRQQSGAQQVLIGGRRRSGVLVPAASDVHQRRAVVADGVGDDDHQLVRPHNTVHEAVVQPRL